MSPLIINIICFYAGMAAGFFIASIFRSAPRDDSDV